MIKGRKKIKENKCLSDGPVNVMIKIIQDLRMEFNQETEKLSRTKAEMNME